MKKVSAFAAVIALLSWGGIAGANIPADTVSIGDPGNAADTRVMINDGTTGYGSVDYSYRIGKYEVTAGQYCAFLNAVARNDTYGLYNTNMDTMVYTRGCNIKRTGTSGSYSYTVATDWANRPVNLVSYWNACRFANWLGNGQKTGVQDASTTERGAYTLDGYTGNDGRSITRNAGWSWAVAGEDEWYKAAYYKGGGANVGYWLYPTGSDTAPGRDPNDISGNNANYYTFTGNYVIGSPYFRTNVGEFENSDSPYGTFDQGGNVWEWNEAIPHISGDCANRGLRGASFLNDNSSGGNLRASFRNYGDPASGLSDLGFRVVQAVPEPSSITALVGGLAGVLVTRRRRA